MNYCPLCDSNITRIKYINKKFISSDVKFIDIKPSICECNNCTHIFKYLNNIYYDSIINIYKNYEIYKLSNGNSELIDYDNSISKNYSLINLIINQFKIIKTDKIKWLDYGCGNGALIDEVNLTKGDICIEGFDEYVINKRSDVTNDFSKINSNYDIITLIHVLEHIEDPKKLINSLLEILNNDGMIVINVPDIELNPFDLFVVDHIHHFNKYSLSKLILNFSNVDFKFFEIIDNQLLLIIYKTQFDNSLLYPEFIKNYFLDSVINFVEAKISDINSYRQECYLFGTSIASLFLSLNSNSNIINYIDDNLFKIGKLFHGIKIIKMSDANKNNAVIFPLGKSFSPILYNRFINYFKLVL